VSKLHWNLLSPVSVTLLLSINQPLLRYQQQGVDIIALNYPQITFTKEKRCYSKIKVSHQVSRQKSDSDSLEYNGIMGSLLYG
jgi:hypothetical protein